MITRSTVKLLIDHCGRPDIYAGLDQPAFKALLALGQARRANVKLSGFTKFSRQTHPFQDSWPFVYALADAFGLEHCMWGSDWPYLRATERLDYGPLLTLAAQLFPDPVARRTLFQDTPRRLFGFGDDAPDVSA